MSFLFIFTGAGTAEWAQPEMQPLARQTTPLSGVAGVWCRALENRGEDSDLALDRTHNRIRSPRLVASSR